MRVKELSKLPVGTEIHVERPGPCRRMLFKGYKHKRHLGAMVELSGEGRAGWHWGESLQLLHLPDKCPY